tara:strand:- start:3391 stop:3672 length:282 start_codon:yes stop_codon:yes gene_type:complete
MIHVEHFIEGEPIDADEDLNHLNLSRCDVVELVHISQMVAAYNAEQLGYSDSDEIPTRPGYYWSYQVEQSIRGPFGTRDEALADLREHTGVSC